MLSVGRRNLLCLESLDQMQIPRFARNDGLRTVFQQSVKDELMAKIVFSASSRSGCSVRNFRGLLFIRFLFARRGVNRPPHAVSGSHQNQKVQADSFSVSPRPAGRRGISGFESGWQQKTKQRAGFNAAWATGFSLLLWPPQNLINRFHKAYLIRRFGCKILVDAGRCLGYIAEIYRKRRSPCLPPCKVSFP